MNLQLPIVIDTMTMPIEDLPHHRGWRRQMLLTGSPMVGSVQVIYGPPGFTPNIAALLADGAHRHVHRTVNERHYVLGGDFPVVHWSHGKGEGTTTKLRRHYYLENPPMTLHGVIPEALPEIGWHILQWTDGPGTELWEPEAAIETFTVPFGADAPDRAFGPPILHNAAALPWDPHPRCTAWKVRHLSGVSRRIKPVALVNIPPSAVDRFAWRAEASDEPNWLFVVSGDLAITLAGGSDDQALNLREGAFIAWGSGTGLTATAPLTDGGAVLLCTGHLLDAAIADEPC